MKDIKVIIALFKRVRSDDDLYPLCISVRPQSFLDCFFLDINGDCSLVSSTFGVSECKEL